MSQALVTSKTALLAIIVTVIAGILGVTLKPENIVAVLGFCGVICASLFAVIKVERAAEMTVERLDIAATKVEEVKRELKTTGTEHAATLKEIQTTGERNLRISNGAYSAQMKIGAVALRRVADLSGHESDIKAAELAEQALIDHEALSQG